VPDLIGLFCIGKDAVIHMAVGIGKEEDFGHQIELSSAKIKSGIQ
jgi:hypothetical protein